MFSDWLDGLDAKIRRIDDRYHAWLERRIAPTFESLFDSVVDAWLPLAIFIVWLLGAVSLVAMIKRQTPMDTFAWLVPWIWLFATLMIWLRSRRPPSVEKLWDMGSRERDSVLEYSPLMDDHFHDERELVRAMEADSIRLRERFKHEPVRQRQIAQDWFDYAAAVDNVKSSREYLNVDDAEEAFEKHFERTKDSQIVIQEIGKRVIDILGEQSQLRSVLDQIEKDDQLPLDERMQITRSRERRQPPPQ